MANQFEMQITKILDEQGRDQQKLLSILLDIQKASGKNYISEEAAEIVSREMGIPLVQLYDILTFYAMLETKPRGRFLIEVCNNAPCYVSKSDRIAQFLRQELGINFGQTTADGLFTLQYMPCVGACDIGPVIKIGDRVYGNLTEEKIRKILSDLTNNLEG